MKLIITRAVDGHPPAMPAFGPPGGHAVPHLVDEAPGYRRRFKSPRASCSAHDVSVCDGDDQGSRITVEMPGYPRSPRPVAGTESERPPHSRESRPTAGGRVPLRPEAKRPACTATTATSAPAHPDVSYTPASGNQRYVVLEPTGANPRMNHKRDALTVVVTLICVALVAMAASACGDSGGSNPNPPLRVPDAIESPSYIFGGDELPGDGPSGSTPTDTTVPPPAPSIPGPPPPLTPEPNATKLGPEVDLHARHHRRSQGHEMILEDLNLVALHQSPLWHQSPLRYQSPQGPFPLPLPLSL